MKFLNLFHKSQEQQFDSISGYDDIKNIIRRTDKSRPKKSAARFRTKRL